MRMLMGIDGINKNKEAIISMMSYFGVYNNCAFL